MPLSIHLPLYRAAVENTRSVEIGIKLFRKDLNRRLCRSSVEDLQLCTKMYVVLFCMWAESLLLRTIYIPYGFSENEVNQVLAGSSVEEKWRVCLQLAFRNSEQKEQKSLRQSLGPKLERLISIYVLTPANIRNKVAHGQWVKAFTRAGNALHVDTTCFLDLIDIIEVDRWFFVFKELAQIIEDGIESPEKAFRRDVWTRLSCIESELERRQSWTTDSKKSLIAKRHTRSSRP